MLLFIVLALWVILTKLPNTLVATDVGFSFDATVAIAGLLSYIGLFSCIFRPQRTGVSNSLAELLPSLRGISKRPIICSKASLHAPQRAQVQDRVWCGGWFGRRTTRGSNASARSSAESMMRGSFALASHRKILPRCVARRARRRPSPHKSLHPSQALSMQRMLCRRAIRRSASAYPLC
jgi:hypothetical protein